MLLSPQLILPPRPVIVVAAATNAVATFDSSASSAAGTSSYTFNTQACGTAVAGRRIIVCVDGRSAGNVLLNTVTVNGNAATQVDKVYNNANNTDIAAIYEIVEATGTTCDVVLTFNGNFSRVAIQIYDVVGSGGVSTVHGTSTANSPTATLSVPSSGCAIGCAALVAAASSTATNLTEDLDNTNGFEVRTSGHSNVASGSTAFTFTPNTGTEGAGAFAAWGP